MESIMKEERRSGALGRAFGTFSAVVLAGLLFTIFMSYVLRGSISLQGLRSIILLIILVGVFGIVLQMLTEWFMQVSPQGIRQMGFRLFELFSMSAVILTVFLFLTTYIINWTRPGGIDPQGAVIVLFLLNVLVLIVSLSLAYFFGAEKRDVEGFIQKMKEKSRGGN